MKLSAQHYGEHYDERYHTSVLHTGYVKQSDDIVEYGIALGFICIQFSSSPPTSYIAIGSDINVDNVQSNHNNPIIQISVMVKGNINAILTTRSFVVT